MHGTLTVFVCVAAACGVSSAGAQERAALDGSGAESGVRMHRIALPTGVALEVAEAGPSHGEPVLFLHGYSDSWYSFAPVLERLPSDLRAIAPSQRGHGGSGRPECCYGTRDFAADAVALLDELGIARAIVVGHSMGSFIAQRIAIEYPERVSRLVLIGSGRTYGTEVVLDLQRTVSSLGDSVPDAFIREFQISTVVLPVPERFMETVIAESRKLPVRVWRDALDHMLATDAARELDRIRVPTLVVWGDRDSIFPRAAQEELLAGVGGARLLTYAGTGHAAHWEQPDRFVADLRAFLKSTGTE